MPRPVLLFVPCFVDLLFPKVGQAAVALLEAAGCRVTYPPGQTCCGQPAFNAGYHDEARRVAAGFCAVFAAAAREAGDGAAIVVPSASCAAMVGHELGELGLAAPAPVFELCAFLDGELAGAGIAARLPARAALYSSCHQLRHLGGDGPARRLLGRVAGLELVETGQEQHCCGFGGTFSVTEAGVSAAMGETKLAAARAAGVDIILTTDSSCGMQLNGLARRQGTGPRVLHVAQVLAGMAG